MPVISVIVPVYNAEAYLRACVDSVLSQSFPDFELILVDDGSPDQCGAICDEYRLQDPRVLVLHQNNAGQASARNHAIRHASGRYYCFVDADDVVHPQMLEFLYDSLEGNSHDIVCCAIIEAEHIPSSFFSPQSPVDCTIYSSSEDNLSFLFSDPFICWTVWGRLLPAEIVNKHLFTEGHVYEDNALVIRWLLEADRLCILNSPLYFYRINPNGTTKSGMTAKKRADYVWALSEQLDALDSHGMKELCNRRIPEFLHTCAQYGNEIKENNPDTVRSLRRFVRPWWRRYLVCDFRNALRERKLFAFFYPGARRIWLFLKACKKRIIR